MPAIQTARIHPWEDVHEDSPIPLLRRKRVQGAQMLVAHVHLAKGCDVAIHSHESEQMACVVSGKVLFRLGDPASDGYREAVVQGGELVELPSEFPHGVVALEDTFILDILSPPGPMGIDSQRE